MISQNITSKASRALSAFRRRSLVRCTIMAHIGIMRRNSASESPVLYSCNFQLSSVIGVSTIAPLREPINHHPAVAPVGRTRHSTADNGILLVTSGYCGGGGHWGCDPPKRAQSII